MTRSKETDPRRSAPVDDVFASLYAFQGIMTTLYHREKTSRGEFIDVSMLDAALAVLTT